MRSWTSPLAGCYRRAAQPCGDTFWGLRIPPDQQSPEGLVALLRATLRHS
jgi:hypothetical protein